MKKKSLIVLSTVVLSAFLAACHNNTKTSGSASSSSKQVETSKSSKTSSSSSSESKKVDYSLYDSVISDYAAVAGGDTASSNVNALANQVTLPTGYYTAVETSRYDLDKNGVNELIVALKSKDGNRSILDIRTIAKDQVVRLTNTDNGLAMIGERMTLAPLENGQLVYRGSSSATDHAYTLYQFNKAGDALEGAGQGAEESDLNLSSGYLDLASLTWESVTGSATASKTENNQSKGMDLDAIQKGDYSSIEGTWSTSRGDSFTFTKDELQSHGNTMNMTTDGVTDGILKSSVSGGTSGFNLYFIPAGVSIPGNDTSDSSRDRLFGTQNGLEINSPEYFYYLQ